VTTSSERATPYHPIGLDLSLTSTGLAVGDETYVIKTDKLRGPTRLAHIRDRIHEHLANYLHDNGGPIVIMLEGYSFASKNSRSHGLGEIGGVMRLWFHDHGFSVVEIPPTCRAKFATGKGNASKSEVVSAVSARTGRVWEGSGAEDECDAWVLQEMGLTFMGAGRYDWPAANRNALNKIEWPLILTIASEGI
jgi:Holliday junction resolvasome RuvABC endonuclease subunit